MNIPHSLKLEATRLFEQMDRAYDETARKTGFVCNGCEDNCCLTRFYHHTLVEYLYIKSGLDALDADVSANLEARAADVRRQMIALEKAGDPVRVMCPLNEDGRCILYAHRPMICRLHGIAHSLRRPDGQAQTGPGCDEFDNQCGPSTAAHLDRTPLYMAMAKLEQQLRRKLGFNEKIKMTIAEIIIDDSIKITA